MHVESGAKRGTRSFKGAMGLMQIMPGTSAELRFRYHLGVDPYDSHNNMLAGIAYILELPIVTARRVSSLPTMQDLDATNVIWRPADPYRIRPLRTSPCSPRSSRANKPRGRP
jgi:hypothetical protein